MPTVPTIDLSNIDAAALAAIDQACLDHGFFKLKGHGLNDAIDEMWREARRFFALPRDIKQSVMRQPIERLATLIESSPNRNAIRKKCSITQRNQSQCLTRVGRVTGLIILMVS